MAIELEIRKKEENVWLHIITTNGRQIIESSFFSRWDGDTFHLIEPAGSQPFQFDISEIAVHDDTDTGSQEVFATSLLLAQRLKVLAYTAFSFGGQVLIADLISTDTPNDLTQGTDGKLLVQVASARSWDFDISKFNTGSATVGNYNGLRPTVTTNTFRNDKATTDISTITNIAGDAAYFFAYVDSYISEIQISMNGTGRFGFLMDTGSVVIIYDEAFSFFRVDTFAFTGSNVVIPANTMFKPYLLMDSGGVFGSFSITITEVPT